MQILQRFSTPTSPGALLQSIHPDLGIRLPGGRPSGVVRRVDSTADGLEIEIAIPLDWDEPAIAVGVDIDGVRHVASYPCTAPVQEVRHPAGRRRGSSRIVAILVPNGDSGPVSLALGSRTAPGSRVYLGDAERAPGPSTIEPTGSSDGPAELEGCKVSFARSQLSIVDNGSGPLLEIAESAGLTPKFGCRRGVCHRCTTELVSGTTVNTRDGTVSEPGDAVRICVSTPVTDVELNL